MVISGWLNIYSAVYNEEHSSIFDISQRYGKQMLWVVLSFVLAFFLLVVDSKFYVSFSYPIYGFFILMLVVVLFFGREVNASKSWLIIGNFAVQPAEFAKLGTSLAIAKLLSGHNFIFNNIKNQLSIIGILVLPIALIFLQNDTGSALVYAIFIIPMFREGMSGLILFFAFFFAILFIVSLLFEPLYVLIALLILTFLTIIIIRKKWNELVPGFITIATSTLLVWFISFLIYKNKVDFYLVVLIASGMSALGFLAYAIFKRVKHLALIIGVFVMSLLFTFSVEYVFDNVLASHQRDRIENLLGVKIEPLGAGYNVNQSKIAIGSGGFSGKGYLQGTQTKYDFVPEQSTDFIFCTVGEEWGFMGSSLIVLAFLFLLIRLVILAERQRSVYSRVFGYCVASIIFFHFAINIGMTIGVAPVIGIPLPFFSYGGSSLWCFTMLLFIFLRLDASRLEQLH